MDERPPPPSPLRLRQYLISSLRRDLRVHVTQNFWDSNFWPPGYNPEHPAMHRITSVLVFCSVWQVPAALAGVFLTHVAVTLGRMSEQWEFALVLTCCAWLPGILIWGIAIGMVNALSRELKSAWAIYGDESWGMVQMGSSS